MDYRTALDLVKKELRKRKEGPSKTRLLEIFEQCGHDLNVAITLIETGLFDKEEMLTMLQKCDYDFMIGETIIETGKLSGRDIIDRVLKPCEEDEDLVLATIDTGILSGEELLELLDICCDWMIGVEIIKTGKLSDQQMDMVREKCRNNSDVIKAILNQKISRKEAEEEEGGHKDEIDENCAGGFCEGKDSE